jgi:hypothetical protein
VPGKARNQIRNLAVKSLTQVEAASTYDLGSYHESDKMYPLSFRLNHRVMRLGIYGEP